MARGAFLSRATCLSCYALCSSFFSPSTQLISTFSANSECATLTFNHRSTLFLTLFLYPRTKSSSETRKHRRSALTLPRLTRSAGRKGNDLTGAFLDRGCAIRETDMNMKELRLETRPAMGNFAIIHGNTAAIEHEKLVGYWQFVTERHLHGDCRNSLSVNNRRTTEHLRMRIKSTCQSFFSYLTSVIIT